MKYAIITGASRGIGKAVAVKLAGEKKYSFLLAYASNDAAAEATLKEVTGLGVSAELLKFDVSDSDETHKTLSDWQEKNPDAVVEVIINNAGISRDGLFMWMPREDWQSVIDTSLGGFFNITNFFISRMLRNKYGRIVNVVSLSGVKGNAGQVNYSAAKAGVIGASKALALEVAKRNITVNCVAPGFIKTEMTENFDEKEMQKMIPANRFGEAEEVADLVAFLASGKASYITGEVININGGIYS